MSYLNSLFQESLGSGYSGMRERWVCTYAFVSNPIVDFVNKYFLILARFTVGYRRPAETTVDSFEGLELNYKVIEISSLT